MHKTEKKNAEWKDEGVMGSDQGPAVAVFTLMWSTIGIMKGKYYAICNYEISLKNCTDIMIDYYESMYYMIIL